MRTTGGKGAKVERRELVAAMWSLAAREGLAACTYRGAAAEAGTSPTPFVRNFPNREAMLTALFEEMDSRFEAARGEAVDEADPVEALVAEGAQTLCGRGARERNRVALDLSFHALRDPQMSRRVKAREKRLSGHWLALVEDARSRGKAREDRPAAEVADQLSSLLSGLVFAGLAYPRRLPGEHVARLWDDGARRLLDPALSPGVHQRLIVPEEPVPPSSLATGPDRTRRQELLAVAFRVTARDGLSGLSFRRLADEAGTSTTPFTYEFGSRQELLVAMVGATWEADEEVKAMASRIASPLDRFFAEWAAELSDDPRQVDRERVYFELHHQALTSPELARLMREADQYGFESSLPFIEAGLEEGLVRDDIAVTDLVDCLYALNDGIGLRRAVLRERRPAGYRIALWEDGGRRMLAP